MPFLPAAAEFDNTFPAKQRALRRFREQPWSLRLVYKLNERVRANHLEVKRMCPSITEEGVVSTWAVAVRPAGPMERPCPFASCDQVSFDENLGVLLVDGLEVTAVRLLIALAPIEETDVVAVPDPQQLGLRVCRKARCAVYEENERLYQVKVAGMSTDVQWLLTAAPGTTFFVTARLGAGDEGFTLLSYLDVGKVGLAQFHVYVRQLVTEIRWETVVHEATDTPCKRLRAVDDAVPAGVTVGPLGTRRRLQ